MTLGFTTQDLSLKLGAITVLDAVSVVFTPGRVTVVLGPNGAGKSTLLACLAGLRDADSGQVLLDGTALSSLPRRDRAQRIGFLPQSPDVHWNVDVRTLISLGRFPHRGRWGETPHDIAAVANAMAATDVASLASRSVESLSGGERGRVLLARVLAGEPQWLLADEPLASLDPAHQIDVLDRLREVAAAGAGVIVVLHDLNQAARVADDIVMLRNGRVIAAGPVADVLTADRIAQTYGVDVHIGQSPDGGTFVIPTGRIMS